MNYIDQKWYEKLIKIAKVEVGEPFANIRPNEIYLNLAHEKFVESDYQQNVEMFPQILDRKIFEYALENLSRLRTQILDEEQNELIRTAYCRRIVELENKAKLTIAAIDRDQESFLEHNVALYSTPNKDVFYSLCHWIRKKSQKHIEHNELQSTLKEKMLEVIPQYPKGETKLFPKQKVFEQVQQLHHYPGGYYDQLFGENGVPTNPVIEQDEGDEICKRVIKNIGSKYTLADSEDGIWSVRESTQQILRPKNYTLETKEFIGIVCHEIGTHLLETINGSKQDLRLLEIGLDHFELGSEGRAYLREQISYINPKIAARQPSWQYIVLLHLGVSLGHGLTGKKYTFSELYKVYYHLIRYWKECNYPSRPINEEIARKEAWQTTVRITKGTDGRGGAYLKDLVYVEGNIRCWKAAYNNPQLILDGDIGRYDITNAFHLDVINDIRNKA